MAYEKSARRFRPVGSRKKKAAPQYSPAGTGCPVVEQAVERLYREQNETHFWNLMNALNYALELKTRVLVPLDAAACLLYTSPSPRDGLLSRMPSSA